MLTKKLYLFICTFYVIISANNIWKWNKDKGSPRIYLGYIVNIPLTCSVIKDKEAHFTFCKTARAPSSVRADTNTTLGRPSSAKSLFFILQCLRRTTCPATPLIEREFTATKSPDNTVSFVTGYNSTWYKSHSIKYYIGLTGANKPNINYLWLSLI